MVRSYKRKSNQQSWSEEAMARAIDDVRNNSMPIKKAALTHQVPRTTLRRHLNKNDMEPNDAAKKKLGRFTTTFTAEQETELANHILEMESRLFGLGTTDLRRLAFEYAERNNIPNTFNREKGLAGRDWIYNFLKRRKNISLRLPEPTSQARATAFNKDNVSKFFALLGEMLEKHSFSPSRIFNCDEAGLLTVPNKPSKIYSLKGKKQVGALSSAERGTLSTWEVCFNAAGFYVPPLVIFPRVRRSPLLEKGLPPDSIAAYHQSGWMQSEIFSGVWFKHFLKYAKPTKEDPVLLVLDGHATHTKNLEFVEMARANNVHVIVLPPHTSHRLQPLDVSFMRPLMTYYEQEVKKWLVNNAGKLVTIYEVGDLFSKAFQRAATTETALNGFRATGIYPYNPDIFPEYLFKPSETTDKPAPQNEETQLQNEVAQSRNEEITCHNEEVEAESTQKHSASPQPGPSTRSSPPSTPVETVKKSVDKDNGENLNQLYFSPKDILPLPKAEQREKKRSVKRGRTMILTATPNYEELKSAKVVQPKKANTVKKQIAKQLPKKIVTENDSSSESSADVEYTESGNSDSDIEYYPKPSGFKIEKINIRDLNINEFILTELVSDKKTKKQFVAQIINIEENSDQPKKIQVKFLRQYRQSKNVFIFPDVDDISDIFECEIVGRVHITNLRHGKMQII